MIEAQIDALQGGVAAILAKHGMSSGSNAAKAR
jgi:hypothetical protein